MQWLAGNSPHVGHIKGVDHRVGLRNVHQIADALHIRLPGEHPQVAYQYIRYGRGYHLTLGQSDPEVDLKGTSGRNVRQRPRPFACLDLAQHVPGQNVGAIL